MIKRTNKITALLIAATSIMSLVPAMAADSTRLATKEGTIQDVVAFKDGKYVYEGYKTDGDNKSVYYNDGQKDTEINNLTDATLQNKYNNDSVIAFDGNDEYLVNLSDGKVTDEDVASDLQSTVKDTLERKLSKTDRYGENVNVDSFNRITPNQFGDVWYEYSASKDSSSSIANGTKAIVDYQISKIQADAIIATSATPITIAGESISLASSAAVAGYTSGSIANFKEIVETKAFTGYTVAVDATTGAVTLTQVAEANNNYATTGAGATVSTNGLQTDVANGTRVFTVGGTIVQPTLVQASTDTLGTIQGKPAIIKFQPTSFTSNIVIDGVAVNVKLAEKTAVTTVSGLKNAIDTHKFANYDVTTSITSTNDILVKLTQKVASNFNQANITIGDYTNGNGAAGTVNPVATRVGVVGTSVVGADTTYTGYTNSSSAYIDADKTANIRVYNGSKMVALNEFDEDANDDGIAATVTSSTTIAQDKDYIYRVINVTFTAGTVYDSKGGAQITTAKYLQKISKAQGDTEKDAYLPKSVESYEITTAVSDDTATAANKLVKYATGTDSSIVGLRVIDGAIYYTEMDDTDTIKTYVLKLQKNEKVQAAGSSSKVDTYVVKNDGDVDHDLKGDAGKAGASIDVDGNLWIINEGKIYKSEKAGDFTEMFTCDRTMDSLEVYNADSLIAWTDGQDVYATMGKKTTETPVTTPVTTTGWVNTATGWTFFKADGTQVKGQWVNDGGVWYMIKADGIMATGWYNDNGTWYFLNASGAMKTGWVLDGSTWYFLQSSGAMKTGWLNDNGTWYYLNASGSMAANTTIDGYKLNASGAWVK